MDSSPEPLEYCYIIVCLPEKALESLCGRTLYEKTQFLAKLTKKPRNATRRMLDSTAIVSSVLLKACDTFQGTEINV